MKKWQKSWLMLLAFSCAIGGIAKGEAALIQVGGPGVVISQAQPVQVVIVNGNGNSYEQTAYYDPSAGGINIDTNWAGPGASIYIPSLGMGYLWHNGYWVDQQGYYWNGSQRIYVSDPQWGDHWHHYWHDHPHNDWHDHHYNDWHEHQHNDWHGAEGWHNRGEGWHGKGEGWHGREDGWHGKGEGKGHEDGQGSWGHENWHTKGEEWRSGPDNKREGNDGWRGKQGNNPNMMHSERSDGNRSNNKDGGFRGGQAPDDKRSGGIQGAAGGNHHGRG